MSYTALYRKFRPDTFEDVKGQDHIVTTLKNQIRADRIGHAWFWNHWGWTVYFWIVTVVLFALGSWIFKRLKPHFADVL